MSHLHDEITGVAAVNIISYSVGGEEDAASAVENYSINIVRGGDGRWPGAGSWEMRVAREMGGGLEASRKRQTASATHCLREE